MRDKTDAFVALYDTQSSAWGGNSGPGSRPYYTLEYRSFLERFIVLNKISSVIDIGCGDWQFSRYINWSSARYFGFDVVAEVIYRNRQNYERDGISFDIMPAKLSELPDAQLVIIKDVLQHLPDREIMELKEQVFLRFPVSLVTNSYEKLGTPQNVDIKHGDFRCLDLTRAPYNFPGAYVLEFGSLVWERIRTLLCFGTKGAHIRHGGNRPSTSIGSDR